MTTKDVEGLFSKLSLQPKSSDRSPEHERSTFMLQEALDQCGFTIFQPIQDLGHFGWNPRGDGKERIQYKSTLENVTVDEITGRVGLKSSPPKVISISDLNRQLPRPFVDAASLSAQSHVNKYPFAQYHVASLHVAVQHRGLQLEEVDFCFGGSTLDVLANCTNDRNYKFLVLLVPGTSQTILFLRHKEYTKNYADSGFQFERFCTGQRMEDRHDEEVVEHLMEMMVGPYRVFFDAESDAIDPKSGTNIEIKVSNPRFWKTSVMFQMISNGSLHLYCGSKTRDKTLTRIERLSLEQVAANAFASSFKSRKNLESNILQCMKAFKEEYLEMLQTGQVFETTFENSKPKLKVYSKSSIKIFPPEAVVKELLNF